MATLRTKFRPSMTETNEGTIYFQILHKRVQRQIYTAYKIFREEWNPDKEQVKIPLGTPVSRRHYLQTIVNNLAVDYTRIKSIIESLDCRGTPYTAEDVASIFSNNDDTNFITFARMLIIKLTHIGKIRTATTYTTTINSFSRFMTTHDDVLLDDFDSPLMIEYETWLKSNNICKNSVSFYMRNLRAIYNRAVESKLTIQRDPFRHVYTGIDKTIKRALPIETVRKLFKIDLSNRPKTDFARDMFMFSFYMRGMSFIDMAYLKKSDLKNGILTYRRHKTGQKLSIKWEKPMQKIINKYDTKQSPYLLPIFKNSSSSSRHDYANVYHTMNYNLKKLGYLLGLSTPLTTYVARHCWASIAKSKNIPLSVISEAMGHDSEATTRIYLATLDTSSVDKANSLIIKSLRQ